MKTAVILAAGEGKKIWPFNACHPKAGLPIGGVPNIIRLVKQLQRLDFQQITVVTHYLEREILSFVAGENNVHILPVAALRGTADALEHAMKQIKSEEVLVIYGDIVVTDDLLKRVIQRFHTVADDGVLLGNSLQHERAQDWFCAKTTEDGQIVNIYGHPRPHYVDHRLMGIYALRTNNLQAALAKTPNMMKNVNVGAMPHMEAEFEQTLQSLVEQGKKFTCISAENQAVDLDKPWHIIEAAKLVTETEVGTLTENKISLTASIHPTAELSGNVILGENVKIGKQVVLEGNAIIGDRTVIDNGAIIGANTIIGHDAILTDHCKIGAHSVIGHHNRFGHCAEFEGVTFEHVSAVHYGEVYGVVGAYTDIAAGVTVGTLRFDDLNQPHKINGRREEPSQYGTAAFIGDHTRTGINTLLMPGIKIGVNCAIGPGVIVNKDVPSGTFLYLEQQTVEKEWGPERYGW
ncbi:NTP transferase domain-containing protein [Lederbergia sp. NSJ-179]|uniref:NTP transferase domain-containing protein n=1 Tax=Lederbergia sp. NSJ-179 TaxID=2931402 RepID=UPI001FD0570A|nr:NTP transferase domain-containing protein [Lederbergia sp. NSJ-179]MCJ7843111.1 NTP transferase domain-containing protein [Lederbergia sp. NSJ-179]